MDNAKKVYWPRTLADFRRLDGLVHQGKSDDEIFRLLSASDWRSEVFSTDDGRKIFCLECRQKITTEVCLECRQPILEKIPAAIADAFDVAVILLADGIVSEDQAVSILQQLNSRRGCILSDQQIRMIAEAAFKHTCTPSKGDSHVA